METPGRLPELAAELVRLNVDVIVCSSGTALVAQRATTTVPIVFANTFDPVAFGLVASLSRPAGNITGISNGLEDAGGKNLEYLMAVVPKLSRVALLWASGTQGSTGVPGRPAVPSFLAHTEGRPGRPIWRFPPVRQIHRHWSTRPLARWRAIIAAHCSWCLHPS